MDGVLAELNRQRKGAHQARQRRELATVRREIEHLTGAIAQRGPLEALLTALQTRQARHDELTTRLHAHALDRQPLDRAAIERKVTRQLDHWRELLTKHVEGGRRVLREVLAGPLQFTPAGTAYKFSGEFAAGALVAGIVGCSPFDSSPTGPVDLYSRHSACRIDASRRVNPRRRSLAHRRNC